MTGSNRRQYRGDGSVPEGFPPATRGERGRYLADSQLISAVNTALIVEQPLLDDERGVDGGDQLRVGEVPAVLAAALAGPASGGRAVAAIASE